MPSHTLDRRPSAHSQCYDEAVHSYLQRLSAIAVAPFSLALGLTLSPVPAMAIEEPSYQQIEQDGDFSLRQYAAVIVAETEVDGTLDQASSAGFRRLAGYIFGANHPAVGSSSNKDRPVTSEATTRIAMTAPVTTYRHGAGWTVNFTMPAQYTAMSLPIPDDGRVKLREIPELTAAVIRFSGWVNESKIAARTQQLRDWMAVHGLTAEGDARLARYNPPWTLPFMRRNEILIPCRKAQGIATSRVIVSRPVVHLNATRGARREVVA